MTEALANLRDQQVLSERVKCRIRVTCKATNHSLCSFYAFCVRLYNFVVSHFLNNFPRSRYKLEPLRTSALAILRDLQALLELIDREILFNHLHY